MTRFENEVAQALISSPSFAPGTAVDYYVDLAYQIAPRVAAAIDEASRNTLSVETARAAGLAALRGVVV